MFITFKDSWVNRLKTLWRNNTEKGQYFEIKAESFLKNHGLKPDIYFNQNQCINHGLI